MDEDGLDLLVAIAAPRAAALRPPIVAQQQQGEENEEQQQEQLVAGDGLGDVLALHELAGARPAKKYKHRSEELMAHARSAKMAA